ncbi:secreted frizzled-related protein 5-like [Arapaima gigas]
MMVGGFSRRGSDVQLQVRRGKLDGGSGADDSALTGPGLRTGNEVGPRLLRIYTSANCSSLQLPAAQSSPHQRAAMRLSDFVPLVPVLLQGLVVDAGRDVGYGEMRLPDFLGYSSLDSQVEPHAERWRALLEMGCHPRAGVFFCSWLVGRTF